VALQKHNNLVVGQILVGGLCYDRPWRAMRCPTQQLWRPFRSGVDPGPGPAWPLLR
jgi:hypothetical protein